MILNYIFTKLFYEKLILKIKHAGFVVKHKRRRRQKINLNISQPLKSIKILELNEGTIYFLSFLTTLNNLHIIHITRKLKN